MDDLDYWFKSFSNKVQDFERTVDESGNNVGDAVVAKLDKLGGKIDKEKRSLETEVRRLVKDAALKNEWKDKISKVEERLAAAKRNLNIKQQQDELFGGNGGAKGQVGMNNDQTLDAAEAVNDQIEDSLQSTLNVVGDTEELGASTLEQLAKQREQITDIHKTVLRVDEALNKSDALIRTFSKRMATDKIIQLFFMLNFFIFVGIIIYVSTTGSTADDDDKGGSAPSDDAPTDDTVRRFLRAASW